MRKSKLYKIEEWLMVLSAVLWATSALSMEDMDADARKAAQTKFFRIVSQKCHESLKDFLALHGTLIDLNMPDEDDRYPLNVAVQTFIDGSRGYESVAILREHGAHFDPREISTQVMWANILHNAVTMRRMNRLRTLIAENEPDEATLRFLLGLMPQYEETHGGDICRDVVNELRKGLGESAIEAHDEGKMLDLTPSIVPIKAPRVFEVKPSRKHSSRCLVS